MLFNIRAIGISLCIYSHVSTALLIPQSTTTLSRTPLAKRQNVLGEAIGELIKGIIGQIGPIIGTSDGNGPCSLCEQGGPDCSWIGGDDGAGNKWAACWLDGTDTFYDFDAATSICLANLHSTQSSVCISVEGSPCAPGYGGGIMNAQVRLGDTQLSSQQFSTMQVAMAAFVQHASFDLNAGVTFAVVTPDFRGPIEEMIVVGHGGQEC